MGEGNTILPREIAKIKEKKWKHYRRAAPVSEKQIDILKENILSATRNSRGEGASDMKSIYELW